MERFLLYFDDLDDLYGMAGLITERFRRLLYAVFSYLLMATVAAAGISLALMHPPIALATSILLFVTLLYRSVTTPFAQTPQSL